jgi:mannose-6-phosphate isomerase-like protein (cupin superfamily)
MELRDGARDVLPGEMIIIPRGVEHRPVGIGETHVLLVEPATTLNTGSATDDPRTRRELARI